MKIAVCVKAVPDTEANIKVAGDASSIDLNGIKFVTSPFDEFAIEEAITLKEKQGGETTVISLGGAECTDVLRDSLARGIDTAIHVNDPDLVNLDPLTAAKVLAKVIKEGNFDLVLCGQQGVGGDNSQLPSILAELLDMPQATLVVKLEIADGKFKAEREIEGAHEIIEGSLPVVISAQKGLNEPRYPSIKGVMAARKKTIDVKNLDALGMKGTVGQDTRRAVIKKMMMPPERAQGKMIEGDADTQAKTLISLLKTEARVL
ncbi:electron transfer flavoprotein subunit beta/FixA family protein [bacterium]|nr:electron transfer flavoprotein subunit beta/FixA family protein [bacterium]QQR58660.1 MAG: electron transfer flavoprotein subunit beta/FixA family protein [Candidatus Melainabacteria bacterium]